MMDHAPNGGLDKGREIAASARLQVELPLIKFQEARSEDQARQAALLIRVAIEACEFQQAGNLIERHLGCNDNWLAWRNGWLTTDAIVRLIWPVLDADSKNLPDALVTCKLQHQLGVCLRQSRPEKAAEFFEGCHSNAIAANQYAFATSALRQQALIFVDKTQSEESQRMLQAALQSVRMAKVTALRTFPIENHWNKMVGVPATELYIEFLALDPNAHNYGERLVTLRERFSAVEREANLKAGERRAPTEMFCGEAVYYKGAVDLAYALNLGSQAQAEKAASEIIVDCKKAMAFNHAVGRIGGFDDGLALLIEAQANAILSSRIGLFELRSITRMLEAHGPLSIDLKKRVEELRR